jgi:multicomponent Na+:H+ antiporter subunit E
MSRILVPRLPLLAWLVVVWVALWGDLSAANVVSGLAVGTLLILVFPDAGPRRLGLFRPWPALVFLAYFLVKLVEANLIVAWEVVIPSKRINQGIVAVPVLGVSDAVVTLVANAISLTPGTLTLEVRSNPTTLYVHVLHLRTIEQVREDVDRLEYLALRAFADERAVAALPYRSGGTLRKGKDP